MNGTVELSLSEAITLIDIFREDGRFDDVADELTEALAMADAAQALGFEIMIGCMVATSLSMAPAMLVTPLARFVDLDGPLLLARDRAVLEALAQMRLGSAQLAVVRDRDDPKSVPLCVCTGIDTSGSAAPPQQIRYAPLPDSVTQVDVGMTGIPPAAVPVPRARRACRAAASGPRRSTLLVS